MIALARRPHLAPHRWTALALAIVAAGAVAGAVEVEDDAEWIWAAVGADQQAPVGDVFFRKSFRIGEADSFA